MTMMGILILEEYQPQDEEYVKTIGPNDRRQPEIAFTAERTEYHQQEVEYAIQHGVDDRAVGFLVLPAIEHADEVLKYDGQELLVNLVYEHKHIDHTYQ